MYGREQRVLLRHYLERGLSKAEVARELGVSRRTVYHWIETGQLGRELDDAPVRYAVRPPVERKIDAFRGIIEARLSEFPRLTATRRLFEEIRSAGYAGGYTRRMRTICSSVNRFFICKPSMAKLPSGLTDCLATNYRLRS